MTVTTVAPWRLFRTRVASVRILSPSLRRVRLVGPELEHFADPGWDQRIKLLVGGRPELLSPSDDDWYAAWSRLRDLERPAMRTYTTRRVSGAGADVAVDIDMVVHDHPGPAGDWLRRAVPGDDVAVVGPDSRYDGDPGGRTFAPPVGTQDVVLIGDETALPAIARTLHDLADTGWADGLLDGGRPVGGQPRVTAIVEVPVAEDRVALVRPVGAEVVWLVRGSRRPGVALDRAVRTWTAVAGGRDHARPASVREVDGADGPGDEDLWEVPPEPGVPVRSDGARGAPLPHVYLWVAGETGVVRGIRRHLLTEVGLDRAQVALMGYWRLGTALG